MTNWATIPVDIDPTLTLLEMLKGNLGIESYNTMNDAGLTMALNIAGPQIENYLQRAIAKQAVEEYFPHHFGTVVLQHPKIDLAEPVTVTLEGVEQTGYSIYMMVGQVGHLTRTGYRQDQPMDWRPYAQVTVAYTAGYDALPTDLASAICYLAADVYKAEGTGQLPGGGAGGTGEVKTLTMYDVGSVTYDVGSESSGGSGGTASGTGIISSTVANMVYPYKRMKA